MKRYIFSFSILLIICILFSNVKITYSNRYENKLNDFVIQNNRFSLSFYQELIDQENVFFSPYSLYSALLILYAGTDGETRTRLEKELGILMEEELLFSMNKQLIKRFTYLNDKPGYDFRIANSFWRQKDFPFNKEYHNLIENYFSSTVKEVDFLNELELSCEEINNWVSKKTNGKIQEIVTPNILGRGTTHYVLNNSLYFKSDWMMNFNKEDTFEGNFITVDREKKKIPIMMQINIFPYFAGDGFEALKLPYIDKEMSMLILLPDQNCSLGKFEKNLNIEKYEKILDNLEEKKLRLNLPSFEIKSDLKLNNNLEEFGIESIFEDNPDFSKMTDSRLLVSKVLHNSVISVNEEGAEAAASSSIIDSRALPGLFNVNRPFMFLIIDELTGSIVFMGRYLSP
ncbi:serpin family protein [Natronospora cellulosivora (SeqCode)]